MEFPKTYRVQNGCWNCENVDRCAVASDVYPICIAYKSKGRFFVENYAICKR